MSKKFKPNISPSNYTFPYEIPLFIKTIQSVFALLNQILGLDNDKLVTEVMMGVVCLVSQSTKEFSLNFDQFLVERISYQLEHFHTEGKIFNYQNLLLLMVISEILTNLRQIKPVNFSDVVDLFERNATISFFTFANSIMPSIYKVIFGSTMPRISEDLKFLLHNPAELIGDWFSYDDPIVIRAYGSEGEPYKLPNFLTRRLFVLEFLKQRLSVENEIFIKHKKVSSMKFKFTFELFVVEYAHVVTIIDQIMKRMDFQTDKSLSYDPKKLIHQRKLDLNLSGYEVEQDEVLDSLANTDFLEQMGNDDNNSSSSDKINPDKVVEGHGTKVPTPLKVGGIF